jgi:hypothetical protein
MQSALLVVPACCPLTPDGLDEPDEQPAASVVAATKERTAVPAPRRCARGIMAHPGQCGGGAQSVEEVNASHCQDDPEIRQCRH